jgi:hypothetical protein
MTDTAVRGGQTSREHPAHPLVPATAAEYLAGRDILAAAGLLAGPVRFAYYGLEEPPKNEVLASREPDRRLRAFLVNRDTGESTDVVVSLTHAGVVSARRLDPGQDGQMPILDSDFAAVDEITKADLSESCTEFGTINSGFGGRPHRYNYAATNEPGWFLFNGLVKHDTLTGREERYQFEPGVFCSEVGVAPRVGGTEEDDAYLVTLTVDMNRDLSECVVFRASDMGWGPIARAQLPERIASGTHNCWAPGESLRGW